MGNSLRIQLLSSYLFRCLVSSRYVRSKACACQQTVGRSKCHDDSARTHLVTRERTCPFPMAVVTRGVCYCGWGPSPWDSRSREGCREACACASRIESCLFPQAGTLREQPCGPQPGDSLVNNCVRATSEYWDTAASPACHSRRFAPPDQTSPRRRPRSREALMVQEAQLHKNWVFEASLYFRCCTAAPTAPSSRHAVLG